MIRKFHVQDLFEYRGEAVVLTAPFETVLRQSRYPFLVTFNGETRTGKSTRLNQILTNELDAYEPFVAESGDEFITQSFQFVEPISLDYLGQVHGIDLSAPSEK
jgi:hypothetical protein